MGNKDCWISPTGKITRVAFARHYDTARDIIDKKGWEDEYRKYTLRGVNYDAVEFLHENKYIRYCDWGARPGWVKNNTPPTKKQERAMFLIETENEKD
jgi:hypothetical protein